MHVLGTIIGHLPVTNSRVASWPIFRGAALISRLFKLQDRYIGLADQDPEFVARAHAEQIRAVVRLTPPMMAGNVLAMFAILLTFSTDAAFPLVALWSLALSFMVVRSIVAWRRYRQRSARKTALPHAIHRATINAAMIGLIWGTIPLVTYIDGSLNQRLVVVAIIIGMISAGSFALSALPRANTAFLIPTTLGSSLSLMISMTMADLVLGILQLAFVSLAMLASLYLGRMLISHLKAENDAIEQKGVIGLLLKSFEDHASDWLWHLDADGQFMNVSQRFAHAAAMTTKRLEGAQAKRWLRRAAINKAQANDLIEAFAQGHAFRDFELGLMVHGQRRWWRLSGEPVLDAAGKACGFRGVGSDITEARDSANRLSYLAHHDGVTGALNRTRFSELLSGLTVRKAIRGGSLALIYVDLDFFKAVNDRYGHRTGDQLLAAVVKRIRALLGPQDLLARLGGDEFAISIEDPADEAEVAALAERIIAAICEPFVIGEANVTIGASLGIVMAQESVAVDVLLHRADLALYIAKDVGRRTFCFFRPDMEAQRRERELLEADLSQAIEKGQLELYYQPFVRSSQGSIAGFEALLRWHHPERGMVPPSVFIPIAEKSPLINQIGTWVLAQACQAAAAMPSHLIMAVNLSSRQFEPGLLAAAIRDVLTQTGVAPERLELEVTESVLIDNPDAVIECLHELKALGIRIAMDDFGTGYSSLSYLWRFPFDKIKLDGAFISALTHDQTARNIVQAIATLSRQMGVRLTAERVETTEEIAFLKEIRCDYLQGYFFSRPLPLAEAAAKLLQEPRSQMRAARKGRNRQLAA
jgi:diguanylate cyclase (GGDEF)-like protein/PAS domain S-box-containing protein